MTSASRAGRASGNVALIVALAGGLLAGGAAIVIDAGLLHWQKERAQAAADGAALAAAGALCESADVAEAIAREVLGESGIAEGAATSVERGRLETDAGGPAFLASRGEDIGAPDEAARVRVRIAGASLLSSLLGLERRAAGAESIAFLPRIDFAALGKGAAVTLARGAIVRGIVVSRGAIEVRPGADTGRAQLFELGADTARDPLGLGGLDAIRPVDEEWLAELELRADRVFVPDDSRRGALYDDNELGGKHTYFFDLTEPDGGGDARSVWFFDAPARDPEGLPVIAQIDSTFFRLPADATGNWARRRTFVSTVPVRISAFDSSPAARFGGPSADQLVVVSSGSIEFERRQQSQRAEGLVLRAGGDIRLTKPTNVPPPAGVQRIRAIADGSVTINDPQIRIDPIFAPPCPPALPRLTSLR